MKIVRCTVTSFPTSLTDPMPKVIVTFENDVEKELFSFYPDEISFTENEFIGLTEDQAVTLKFTKDKNFLQSNKLIK